MLLLLWPKYQDEDTHDGGDPVDYSNYGKSWKKEETRQPAPPLPVEQIPATIEAFTRLEAPNLSDFEAAQQQLAALYQNVGNLAQQLESIEAQRRFLEEIEGRVRAFLEKQAKLRREEEELLAILLCQ